jgi:Na+/H+-translocating membrane pyrophosphatase
MRDCLQVIMSIAIFSLLSVVQPEGDRTKQDEMRNGIFSSISFILGAATSILSGFLGMKIATYANARTALEARKGIAPAFMCGEHRPSVAVIQCNIALLYNICLNHCLVCSLPFRRRDGLPAGWLRSAQPVRLN